MPISSEKMAINSEEITITSEEMQQTKLKEIKLKERINNDKEWLDNE